MTLLPLALALVLATACGGSQMNQVSVKGEQTATMNLAGQWEGVFEGVEAGQKGRMEFLLDSGHHTGQGAIKVYDGGKDGRAIRVLKLERVEIKNGQFIGSVAPYKSDRCDCIVRTEFRGLVQGDVIDGTFTATLDGTEGSQTRVGSWALYRDTK